MKRNDDLTPGRTVGVLAGSCLFIIAFWVAVALAIAAVK